MALHTAAVQTWTSACDISFEPTPHHLSACLLLSYVCSVCAPPCRRKHASYRELAQRLERHQKLSSLASKMEMDKQVMGRGRKRKMKVEGEDGSSTTVFRWKRERSK